MKSLSSSDTRIVKYASLSAKLKVSLITLVSCYSLTACVSNADTHHYADKSCDEIQKLVRQEFLNNTPDIYSSIHDKDEPNNAFDAIFQSDDRREEQARKRVYNEKC